MTSAAALLKQLEALPPRAAPLGATPDPATLNLEGFIRHTKPDYDCQWFHALWCATLDRFVSGELPRLMVFAPPQHGKSQIVSRHLPAYVLGRDPDARVMACSHTADLASRMNRDVQRVMDSPAYAGLFPGARLPSRGSGGAIRRDDFFEIARRRGSYRSAGVGGAIVGMGFDVGVIDDPVKSQEQALSAVYREKVWEWYTSDFLTRQARGARILLTVTRWHVDDLAGRLLRLQKEDPAADRWHVLRFPALAEDPPGVGDQRAPGEPLWPGRYDLDFLARQRAALGSYQFAALYGQKPIPEEGGLYSAGWFNRFEDLPGGWRFEDGTVWPHTHCWRFAVLDPATGKNHLSDYTVLGTFAVTPDKRLLVLDVLRERVRLEDLMDRVKAAVTRWGPSFLCIEANGFQIAVVREARKVLSIPVREVLPEGKGKHVRAMPSVVKAEAGEIYLPRAGAPWVGPFLDELGNWTAQDGDRDDQVDVLAYAVLEMVNRGGAMRAVELPPRPANERVSDRERARRAPPPTTLGRGRR